MSRASHIIRSAAITVFFCHLSHYSNLPLISLALTSL
jgi:hypothetical protein